MYKKQMTLQRLVCFFVLIAAALVFVYSLGLVTDMYESSFDIHAQDYYLYDMEPAVPGTEIFYQIQGFNRTFTVAGLVLILLAVSQFVFQNHNRRKYYIANYITVALNAVAGVAVAVWSVSAIMTYKAQYLQIDEAKLKEVAELKDLYYTLSTFWFDLSIAVAIVLVVANVLNVANLVWKKSLMKAEAKLIQEGKEV